MPKQPTGISVTIPEGQIKAIQDLFAKLPKRIKQRGVWLKLWREVTKPLIKQAKAMIPVKSGQAKKSIGFFTTKASRKWLGGYVGHRYAGTWAGKKKTGFYGRFVEWGTYRHGSGRMFAHMMPAWDRTEGVILRNAYAGAEKIFDRAIAIDKRRIEKYGILGY